MLQTNQPLVFILTKSAHTYPDKTEKQYVCGIKSSEREREREREYKIENKVYKGCEITIAIVVLRVIFTPCLDLSHHFCNIPCTSNQIDSTSQLLPTL